MFVRPTILVLFALPAIATAQDGVEALSVSLDRTIERYADATTIPPDHCDPVDDAAGTCASSGNALPAAPTRPAMVGIAVVGATVDEARRLYAETTSRPRVDCDPLNDGRWICASFADPTIADVGQTPAPVPEPPLADPALADSVPVNREPAASAGAWPTPDGRANAQRVPRKLHAWHKTNLFAESNLVTYRDGRSDTLTQAFLFLDGGMRWQVVTRDFPAGSWSAPLDVHDAVSGRAQERDSHNNGFIGVTSSGTIFAGANHHVDPASLAKSARPWDWQSLARYPRNRFPPGATDRWTYPSTFMLNGRLHLSVREQETNRGPEFRWLSFAYDEQADRWTASPDWNSGIALREYAGNVTVDATGETAHVFSTWRDESNGDTGGHLHRGVFHKYTRDNAIWYGLGSEEPLDLPLWLDIGGGDPGAPVPRYAIDPSPSWIPNGRNDAAVDAAGNPHSLVERRGGGTFWVRWESGRWQTTQLPWGDQASYSVVPIGEYMYGLYLDGGGAVFAGRLDPSHPTYRQPRKIAEGFHNGASELCFDYEAARLGWLSMVGQKTLDKGWSSGGDAESDGDIVTIPLALIARDDDGVIISR